MTESKRRIYLRLIDLKDLQKSDEELLLNVKNSIDAILEIEWLKEPSFHIKGGYIISGNISSELDLDSLPVKLKKAGFMAVI